MNDQRKMTETVIDDLTGLNHHTQYRKKIEQEINRISRHKSDEGGVFSMLLFELGNLDYVTGQYGKEVKDFLVVEFAGVLKKLSRSLDYLSRYDDHVFGVILEETDQQGAMFFAERVFKDLDLLGYFVPKLEEYLNCEISIPPSSLLFCNAGIITYTQNLSLSIDEMIQAAGNALMEAIETGPNSYVSLDLNA